MLILNLLVIVGLCAATLPDARPAADKRTFQSSAIDSLITTLKPLFLDPDMATLFSNCLPNTLDTTVSSYTPAGSANLDTFIITGDIDALWLRDSGNQVVPYLPYGPSDPSLQSLFEGLIARHANSVLIDPFANSFNYNASGAGHQADMRTPPMSRGVFEGKYEIDSLAAFLKLSYWHWRYSGDAALERFATDKWFSAVDKLLDTVQTMQTDTGTSSNPPYKFSRVTSQALDTLMMSGRGPIAKPNGMTRSLFRPSDDAVTLPYNIPGNAMICVELNHLQTLLGQLPASSVATKTALINKDTLSAKAKSIADGICGSLARHVTKHSSYLSASLPFEVDGYGGEFFMDDANVPSLLALPLLGYMSAEHPVYKKTRGFVLSAANPYFFAGVAGEGVGGPHVGVNYSWPMAIVTRAMTSDSADEVKSCLSMLLASTAGTGFMHESFNVNNAADYTRDWFAWANGLFGELVLQVIAQRPELLIKPESIALAQSVVQTPVSILAQQDPLLSK